MNLDFEVRNIGGKGDVALVLQRAVEGGFWEDVARVDIVATAGGDLTGSLPTVANAGVGESIEFRLLVLVDEVEMDRASLDPLFIKEQTIRDGEALAKQAQEGTFSIVLYIIALLSLSMAMYLLVMNRRIREGDLDAGAEDQTDEVLEDLEKTKQIPSIDSNLLAPSSTVQPTSAPVPAVASAPPRAPPPLPPTGLPEGWTLDQWNHFGWQYIESMKK